MRHCGGEPVSELGQRCFGRERERGPEVVVLALEGRVGLDRSGRVAGDELLAQLEEVLGVATPHVVGVRALRQALERVFADRQEHPVPPLLRAPDEAALDELGQRRRVRPAHGLGSLAREAARERAEDGEEPPGVRLEQLVAPTDRRAQGPLPFREVARPLRRELEPVVERLEQLGRRQVGRAGGDELDRERQSVEPAADLGDERPRRQGPAGRARPSEEELLRVGRGQGRQQELVLPVHAQTRAARDQDAQPRRRLQQLADEWGRFEQLLEVVQEEQELASAQLVLERVLGEPERLRDRRSDERRVDERGQADEPDAVGERAGELVCRPKRDPRLAGAAGPGERDDPAVTAEQGRDCLDLRPPADERRRRRGQVAALAQRLRLDVERGVLAQDRALERS